MNQPDPPLDDPAPPAIVPAPSPQGANFPILRRADGSIDEVGTLSQRLAIEPAENIPAIIEAIATLREQAERERDGHARRRRAMIDTVGNLAMSAGAGVAGVGFVAFFDEAGRQAFGYFLAGIGGFRVAAQFVLGYFRIPFGQRPQGGNQP